jgi:radical SAM protein with 4Fe4S-binding SPASM domain
MWSSSVITWDGNLVPCCFDKDAKHKMGNLLSSNFRQIWFSEGYSSFRKQIFTNRNTIDMCKNCTEGASVFET